MKLRTSECLSVTLASLLFMGCLTALHGQGDGGDTPPPLGVATPAPTPDAPTASPAKADGKAAKGAKGPKDPSKPARVKPIKEIPFPLAIGSKAGDLKIPELNAAGQLISQLMAVKANHIDNEHVQMEEMRLDLNHSDGTEDFHIILPTSVFNLKTRIISSEDPVTIRTQDFELTGVKMEFNTVDRSGSLLGHVHMVIHNLKQVANLPQSSPDSK